VKKQKGLETTDFSIKSRLWYGLTELAVCIGRFNTHV